MVFLVYIFLLDLHWGRNRVLTSLFRHRINIPVNVLTLTVISLFFRPRQGRGGRLLEKIKSLDLVGCVIFVPGIFMLLLALQTGSKDGIYNTPTVIGLFVGSGVTLLLFVTWEWRKGDQAMIPGSVVLRRTVMFTCLFASMQMGGLLIASYYLPTWFQTIQGVNPLQSGVRMLPTIISQMLATILASSLGEVSSPYGFYVIMSSGVTDSMAYSNKTQILQSVVLPGAHFHVHFQRAVYDVHRLFNPNKPLDRIPNHPRHRYWLRHADEFPLRAARAQG